MKRFNVPKPNAFTAKGGYSGTVNGVNISKNVMLDNSNSNADVIHIMLTTPYLCIDFSFYNIFTG